MVRLAHVVTILLVTVALAQAQAPVTTLSLDDAVTLALRENPTVRAKQHEYRATQAHEITAGLRHNPTASLVAEATLALAGENLRTIDEVERLQRIRAEKGDISELELTRIQVQRFA